jgi:hypothetical protein
VSQIECPTLFIVTSDGYAYSNLLLLQILTFSLYKDAKIAGQPFYTFFGYFIYTTLYRLCYALFRLPVVGVIFYKFYYRLHTPMSISKYLRAYANLKVCRGIKKALLILTFRCAHWKAVDITRILFLNTLRELRNPSFRGLVRLILKSNSLYNAILIYIVHNNG